MAILWILIQVSLAWNNARHWLYSFLHITTMTLEFFLNGQNFQWIQRIQGIWKITEPWIVLNLKILSLTYVLLALGKQAGLLNRR